MGQLLSGSRSVYALAEHGDLPAVFARVHPDYRTPYVAIWFTTHRARRAGAHRLVRVPGGGERRGPAGDLPVHLPRHAVDAPRPRARRGVTPASFTVPLGPVIPIVASLISLSILAGATSQQLLAGLAALGRRDALRPGPRRASGPPTRAAGATHFSAAFEPAARAVGHQGIGVGGALQGDQRFVQEPDERGHRREAGHQLRWNSGPRGERRRFLAHGEELLVAEPGRPPDARRRIRAACARPARRASSRGCR